MSSTTILAIRPGEKFDEIEELRNSWHSAPVVWDVIAKRYGTGSFMSTGNDFWNLHADPRLTPSDRALFMMTFDRAYVLQKDYLRAAADIREFMRRNHVSGHWQRIHDLFSSRPDHPAIGFRWTSVSENPFQGAWNEDLEDYDQIDWSRAWSLYDSEPMKAEPAPEES